MNFYTAIRAILGNPVLAINRVHIHGQENIPDNGPLLICPNHVSANDPVVLVAAIKNRQLRFMAKAELFKIPVLNLIIKAFGAFPIKRGSGDVGAIKNTVKLLRDGECVGMFIQGTRCAGKEPKDTVCRHGSGLVTYRSGCDVLPVAIKMKDYKARPLRRIDITFGELIKYEDFNFTDGSREEVRAAAEKIFAEMVKLSERSYK